MHVCPWIYAYEILFWNEIIFLLKHNTGNLWEKDLKVREDSDFLLTIYGHQSQLKQMLALSSDLITHFTFSKKNFLKSFSGFISASCKHHVIGSCILIQSDTTPLKMLCTSYVCCNCCLFHTSEAISVIISEINFFFSLWKRPDVILIAIVIESIDQFWENCYFNHNAP